MSDQEAKLMSMKVLTEKLNMLGAQIRTLKAFRDTKMSQFYEGHGLNVLYDLRSATIAYLQCKKEMKALLESHSETCQTNNKK